ncbi:MAG: heme exporter protein CcmD [Rubrivivax sp.]|jgi:heme exporter protein D|nr:heme exporter protein CcmD [Rubrivivax sp.]
MNWGSLQNFLDMGGAGLYVWGSYGAAVLLMVLEPMLAARRRRRALQDIRDDLDQEQR